MHYKILSFCLASFIFFGCLMVETVQSENKSDKAKIEQAEKIFQKFKSQSNSIDRNKITRMTYISAYKANLRNALMWVVHLENFGDCEQKVKKFNQHLKFKYKQEGKLSEKNKRTIDAWSKEIKNRCAENERELLEVTQDAIETCQESLRRFANKTPLPMYKDTDARQEIQIFLENDPNYKEFKDKKDKIRNFYPNIYKHISLQISKWTKSTGSKADDPGLPQIPDE